jgi:tetratricopeptide (TPR) repeat protein
MEEHAPEQPAVAAGPAATLPVAPPSREAQLAAALSRLDDPTLNELELQALWREYSAAGLTADLIAAFEARAEAAPNDPDAQVAAAGAYLAKIFEVGNSPEAGVWATKADQAFNRALAVDDHHWEARFEKAVSLSFWPPVFGKQGEAIRQFEILAKQQEGQPAEPRHAQTHLLLGNMYRQIGEEERARAAWQHGLELYPGNEALLGQLEVFSNDG